MIVMPGADATFGWQEAMAGFAMISIVAFLVTWIVTDLAHVSRTPYIAILFLTTLGLGTGYVMWSGTSVADLATGRWGWGILAGLLAAGLIVPLVRRLPARPRAQGGQLAGRLIWEGVVYGAAEAVLLATLPVVAVWQATDALGWTGTDRGSLVAGTLAVIGALFVILVHHLGYREFRAKAARKMLGGALVACGIQALAFLLTGSIVAPVVAHIFLHCQLTLRGDEMPPVYETEVRIGAAPLSGGIRTESLAKAS
jgi:hypothetical protein